MQQCSSATVQQCKDCKVTTVFFWQRLPTFGKSLSDRTNVYKELSDAFESSVSSVTCRLSDNVNTDVAVDKSVAAAANLSIEPETVVPRKGSIYFWTGITKRRTTDGKSQFVNEYSGEPVPWDLNLWPGPVVGEGCTMVRGPFLVIHQEWFEAVLLSM